MLDDRGPSTAHLDTHSAQDDRFLAFVLNPRIASAASTATASIIASPQDRFVALRPGTIIGTPADKRHCVSQSPAPLRLRLDRA